MNGKRPRFARTPDGCLTSRGCLAICNYWAEEDEWEGRTADAEYWRTEAEHYQYEVDNRLFAWISSPKIENRLASESNKWATAIVPWSAEDFY